jgi:hypothetical protein
LSTPGGRFFITSAFLFFHDLSGAASSPPDSPELFLEFDLEFDREWLLEVAARAGSFCDARLFGREDANPESLPSRLESDADFRIASAFALVAQLELEPRSLSVWPVLGRMERLALLPLLL